MKIGIVCYPTYGGSGVLATELGKALAQKGYEIHFITYHQPVKLDHFSENLFYHEVVVSDYPLFDYSPYELVLASKLVDVVKSAGLDLLHVHYAIPHASAAYMAKQILLSQGVHIPYITTLHGTDITLLGKDSSFEPVITFAINHSDAVTAVSESLKADTLKYFKVEKEIRVIHNFVCMDKFPGRENSAMKKYFAPGGEKVLLHISNFRKVKRVEDVVAVFDKVRKEIPARLVLVGDGPERHNIERLCRKLDTCDNIKMLGKLKDTEEILSACDLFLLTSETESFGLAALEAMAAGLPVISTNTGGIGEVNEHGYSGYLSGVGDVDGMTANALKILRNDQALKTFKINAQKRAALFDIKKILPRYEELYRQVIKTE